MPRMLTRRWQGPAIILVLVLLVFGNAVRFGFLEHDDDRHISNNPRMQALSLDAVSAYWRAPFLGLYIPVTYTYWSGITVLSYALDGDAQVPSIKPWLYHLSNVLLHAANGVLVLFLLEGFGASTMAALIGGLFFTLHPIQVEAVAWVSGAKDVLSGFFGLSALLFYSWFLRRLTLPQGTNSSPWPKLLGCYVAAYAAFSLAIMAKPAEVILPPLFVLMALYTEGRWRWRSVLLVIPHLLTVAWYLKVASVTQGTEGPFPPVPWSLRPLIAGDAWIFYLQKAFIPVGFALDYGRRPDLVMRDTWLLVRGGLPYVIGVALLWRCWRQPTPGLKLVAILLAAFAVALLPTLGFLQFAYQFFSMVCDRYAYLAMLAPAILVAALYLPRTKTKPVQLIFGLILAGLAVQSAFLVDTWSSERKLFGHSLEQEPNGAVALVGFSNDTANSGNWRGTIPLLQRAEQALPEWSRPHNNMGTTHMNLGETKEAADEYAAAIKLHSAYPLAHCNRCAALTDLGRVDEAIFECREAIRLASEYQQAYTNLGSALTKAHRLPEAEKAFAQATSLAPTAYGPRQSWATNLQEQGRWSESLDQWSLLHRQYPYYVRVVVEMGKSLLALGRADEAERLYADYAKIAPDQPAQAEIAAAIQALHLVGPPPPLSHKP